MELVFKLQGCDGFPDINVVNASTVTRDEFTSTQKRARVFNLAAGITTLLFGIPGAVLSTLVNYKNSSKKSALTSLLITNAVTSIGVLTVAMPGVVARCYGQLALPWALCASTTWLVATMNCVNVYSFVLLLTTRYLAVAFPHTLFIKLLSSAGLKSMLGLSAGCGLYCVRFFFLVRFNGDCTLEVGNRWVLWLFVVVEFVLPVVLTGALSALLVVLIRSDRLRVVSSSLYNQKAIFRQLTVLSSCWILMTSLPVIVHNSIPLAWVYGQDTTDSQWPLMRQHVAAMLILHGFFVRHAFDVLVYLTCSRRFRGVLVDVMRLERLCGQTALRSIKLEAMYTQRSEESSRSPRSVLVGSRSTIVAQLQSQSSHRHLYEYD